MHDLHPPEGPQVRGGDERWPFPCKRCAREARGRTAARRSNASLCSAEALFAVAGHKPLNKSGKVGSVGGVAGAWRMAVAAVGDAHSHTCGQGTSAWALPRLRRGRRWRVWPPFGGGPGGS